MRFWLNKINSCLGNAAHLFRSTHAISKGSCSSWSDWAAIEQLWTSNIGCWTSSERWMVRLHGKLRQDCNVLGSCSIISALAPDLARGGRKWSFNRGPLKSFLQTFNFSTRRNFESEPKKCLIGTDKWRHQKKKKKKKKQTRWNRIVNNSIINWWCWRYWMLKIWWRHGMFSAPLILRRLSLSSHPVLGVSKQRTGRFFQKPNPLRQQSAVSNYYQVNIAKEIFPLMIMNWTSRWACWEGSLHVTEGACSSQRLFSLIGRLFRKRTTHFEDDCMGLQQFMHTSWAPDTALVVTCDHLWSRSYRPRLASASKLNHI